MRLACFLMLFMLSMTSFSWADNTSIQRLNSPLEYCKASTKNFAEINKCLPSATVAFSTLKQFHSIYSKSSQKLVSRCEELNKLDIGGTLTCVTVAIENAVQLKQRLKTGETIDDPLFEALSSASDLSRLETVIKNERAKFPDVRLWGGSTYRPYR